MKSTFFAYSFISSYHAGSDRVKKKINSQTVVCCYAVDGLDSAIQRGAKVRNTVYWEIFTDVYNLMKSSWPVLDAEGLIDGVNDIHEKYRGNKFADDLLLAVLAELEWLQ